MIFLSFSFSQIGRWADLQSSFCFCVGSWHSINWTPEFVLKRYILSGIRDGPQEPAIADSIDFVVSQVPNLFFMWLKLRDSHFLC